MQHDEKKKINKPLSIDEKIDEKITKIDQLYHAENGGSIYVNNYSNQFSDCFPLYPDICIPELFWKAGKCWYENVRKPGARFHTLDIVNHILPSGSDKPERSDYCFPFTADDTNEHTIQCSRFSNLIHENNSYFQNGHFILVGEGGIGKTTTLMSAMYDSYEAKSHYSGETIVPLFIELSQAPDSQESHAYDGTTSSVVYRLIYAMLLMPDSGKSFPDIIRKCMNDPEEIAKETVQRCLITTKNYNTKYVFLIDGLNEVSAEHFSGNRSSSAQSRILNEIFEIANDYDNLTIVLTSRNPVVTNPSSFHTFFLRGLEWKNIETYLLLREKKEADIKKIKQGDKGLLDILAIPMFLTMYIELKDTEGITTRGELMKVFFHERFERRMSEYNIHRQTDISKRINLSEEQSIVGKMTRSTISIPIQCLFLDVLIPVIAEKMEERQVFHISEKDVRTIFFDIFNNKNSIYYGRFKSYSAICFDDRFLDEDLESTIDNFLNGFGNNLKKYSSAFINYCESHIGILYKETVKTYGFIHQHFRDYFASVSHVNRFKVAYTAYTENDIMSAREILYQYNNKILSPILVSYIGEYLGEHHNSSPSHQDTLLPAPIENDPSSILYERMLISNLFDIYRDFNQDESYTVFNLVEILKTSRKGLNGADFHDLDLRNCYFYDSPSDAYEYTNFDNAIINSNSWFNNGHTRSINNAHFINNGTQILTASEDHSFRISNTLLGRVEKVYDFLNHSVNDAFFCDEENALIAEFGNTEFGIWNQKTEEEIYNSTDYWLYVEKLKPINYDLFFVIYKSSFLSIVSTKSGEIVSNLFLSSKYYHINISMTGKYVVLVDVNITLFDNELKKGYMLKKDADSVIVSSISMNDRYILISYLNGGLSIWDSYLNMKEKNLNANKGYFKYIKISPDSSIAFLLSDKWEIWIYSLEDDSLICSNFEHNPLSVSVISPDNKRLISGYINGVVIIRDLKTLRLEHGMSEHKGAITSIEISKDNRSFVTSSTDCTAIVWDINTGRRISTIEKGDQGVNRTSVALHYKGKLMAIALEDGTIQIWDSLSLSIIRVLHEKDHIHKLVLCDDCETILSLTRSDLDTSFATLWNIETKQIISKIEIQSAYDRDWFVSQNHKWALYLSHGSCYIWDIGENNIYHIEDSIRYAALSPDCEHFSLITNNKTIQIWNLLFRKMEREITVAFNVSSLSYSTNGEYIYTHVLPESDQYLPFYDYYYNTFDSGFMMAWYVKTAVLSHTPLNLPKRPGSITYNDIYVKMRDFYIENQVLVFSPDGTRILSAGKETPVSILNAEKGIVICNIDITPKADELLSQYKQENELKGEQNQSDNQKRLSENFLFEDYSLKWAGFSDDNGHIFILRENGSGGIWNGVTGKHEQSINVQILGNISSIRFSADGKKVLIINDRGQCFICHSATGNCFIIIENGLYTAFFTPDSWRIITITKEFIIKIWDVKANYEKPIYNVNLNIQGLDLSNISLSSHLPLIQKEIFRQYGAII